MGKAKQGEAGGSCSASRKEKAGCRAGGHGRRAAAAGSGELEHDSGVRDAQAAADHGCAGGSIRPGAQLGEFGAGAEWVRKSTRRGKQPLRQPGGGESGAVERRTPIGEPPGVSLPRLCVRQASRPQGRGTDCSSSARRNIGNKSRVNHLLFNPTPIANAGLPTLERSKARRTAFCGFFFFFLV